MTTILYFLLFLILSIIGILIIYRFNFNKGGKSKCKHKNHKNHKNHKRHLSKNFIKINDNKVPPSKYVVSKRIDSNRENEYNKFYWSNNK